MAEFRLTPRAHKDLKNIAAYTLKIWGRDQVETYLSALTPRMQWLADNPELGRSRNDISRGYKCFPKGQHLIFFVVKPDHIAIIGVPHSSVAWSLPATHWNTVAISNGNWGPSAVRG